MKKSVILNKETSHNTPQNMSEEAALLYCCCPFCQIRRKKAGKQYNIVRRGYERNGLARFFCLGCERWFNERTGDSMRWMGR